MENREEERKLLDAAGVEGRVLSMKDGGQEVGYVIVDLQEGLAPPQACRKGV